MRVLFLPESTSASVAILTRDPAGTLVRFTTVRLASSVYMVYVFKHYCQQLKNATFPGLCQMRYKPWPHCTWRPTNLILFSYTIRLMDSFMALGRLFHSLLEQHYRRAFTCHYGWARGLSVAFEKGGNFHRSRESMMHCSLPITYRQVSNIRRTLVGN